jgi:hypothetical protein
VTQSQSDALGMLFDVSDGQPADGGDVLGIEQDEQTGNPVGWLEVVVA